MIRSIFITLLLANSWAFFSCSSTNEQTYSKTEVEGRADEYSAMGDALRNDRKYAEAYNYYQIATDMYLMKGSKEKFVLTRLKQAILLLKEERFAEFLSVMKSLEIFNRVEKLALDKQIDYINARYFYQNKETSKGNAIILELIKKYDEAGEFEQRGYYQFYFASQNIAAIKRETLPTMQESLAEINKLYENGKLTNTEALTFANYTMCTIYLQLKDFEKAKKQIEYTESIYELLELTSKRDQILNLYIELYSALNNNEKRNYYLDLKKEFDELVEKY